MDIPEKSKSNSYDIWKYPLRLLKITGLNPEAGKIKRYFVTGLYIITYIIFTTSTVVNFNYLNGNLILFVTNSEGIFTLLQIFGKVLVINYWKNNFIELINEAKTWKMDNCPEDLKPQLLAIVSNAVSTQRMFVYSMGFATIIMETTPYFFKQFPTGIWNIPNRDELYLIILILQNIACPFYIMVAVCIDCLFIAFCSLLAVQFRILGYSFEKLKIPYSNNDKEKVEYLENLKTYVERHTYLVKYEKMLQDTYAQVILLEYLSISVVAFLEMYLIFQSDIALHFIRGVLFLVSGLFQLSIYCVSAQFTMDEAARLTNAVYNSDWYSEQNSYIKNSLPIVIQRTQREMQFTACGLVVVNHKTLIAVIKFAWSACTLIRGLNNKQQ